MIAMNHALAACAPVKSSAEAKNQGETACDQLAVQAKKFDFLSVGLDVYSDQSQSIKKVFDENDALRIAALRSIIFDYCTNEWVPCKTLSTCSGLFSWVFPVVATSGYPPIVSLEMSPDHKTLRAHLDHLDPANYGHGIRGEDDVSFKSSDIVWQIGDGSYTTTKPWFNYAIPYDWATYKKDAKGRYPMIAQEVCDGVLRLQVLSNPTDNRYDNSTWVVKNHTVTIEANMVKLLKVIIHADPQNKPLDRKAKPQPHSSVGCMIS